MGTFILGLALGIISGMLLMAVIDVERINESDSLAAARTKALKNAEKEITKKNEKIIDLENNLELVTNTYEHIKKEAISSDQTTDNFKQK